MPKKKKAELSPDNTMKLTRCVCGAIYDLLVNESCPHCKNVKMETSPITTQSLNQDTTPNTQPINSLDKASLIKLAKIAAVLLVLAYIVRISTDWTEDDIVQNDPEQVTENVSPAEHSTESDYKGNATTFLKSVDPKLVGNWEQYISGVRWSISITSDGKYQFSTSMPQQIPSHSGTFQAKDGSWSLHSETIMWDDLGSYQTPDPQTFVMYGKLGTGMWKRATSRAPQKTSQKTTGRSTGNYFKRSAKR
jgi:hypothetical protein